jgi:dolichol-phosphate mannosyltransferase
LPLDLKVLVVDDNSPDSTGKLAEELAAKNDWPLSVLHRPAKQGLGTAYIQGFQNALVTEAQAIGQMDADFSHPPELLVQLMETLETCDLALGSRYIPGGSVDKRWPLWRKGLSAFGNFYARAILNLPERDVTGGYRIWSRETLLGIPFYQVRSNGYAFQVEMLYLAHRLGYVCNEVPFHFADRRWGQSKMSFKIQREAALRVWQILFLYRSFSRVEVRADQSSRYKVARRPSRNGSPTSARRSRSSTNR